MKIKVCIPHYFGDTQPKNTRLKSFYGSFSGNVTKKSKALDKCLSSLIHSVVENNDVLVNNRIDNSQINFAPKFRDSFNYIRVQEKQQNHDISISVITDGKNVCKSVLDKYRNFIDVVEVNIDDSMNLVFEAREHLLKQQDYDLYFYCEDDIGVYDKEYFDKIDWFAKQTNNNGVLMPNRYESICSLEFEKLYVDGPIYEQFVDKYTKIADNAIQLNYQNEFISFDQPSNTHSGTFCLTKKQRDHIIEFGIERDSGFISSLESAGTLTVMQFFQVYKPNFKQRKFLEVEHLYTRHLHTKGRK